MLVDTHCHIHDARFDPDRAQVLKQARDAGVGAMVSIGCDLATTRRALALAQVHHDIYFSAGYHPHEAKDASPDFIDELRSLAAHKKCVAIGECGLDYHYNHSPKETQNAIFEKQIALAVELKKALVIHVRDAFDDCLANLSHYRTDSIFVVIHCFTGSLAVAKRILDLGFYLSISGIVTFKDPGELDKVAAFAPLERLLIETDSPYLAPLPYRGKRNEPAYLAKVAERLAELRGAPLDEITHTLTRNSIKVFKISCHASEGWHPDFKTKNGCQPPLA